MIKMENYLKYILNKQFLTSAIIIILSVILYKLIYHILTKSENGKDTRFFTGKKSKTYVKLIKSIIRYVFVIVTVLIVLKVNGIDVSSALAGVGIVGVVFGLAIQDWIKDIIRGSSIISDNYFCVGEVVKYKDVEGVIGLKSTKIQDLKTGNIRTIANRNIEEIDVVSNLIYIDVPMSYELTLEKSEKIIENVITEVKKNENVNNCTYIGVNGLEASFINYYLKIECNPLYKLQVRRDALRTVLAVFEEIGVEVPYTQIDIHEK